MRPISGFERPGVQWAIAGGSLVLMTLLALSALSIRRSQGQIEELLASHAALRSDYQALEGRLARERSAREAFELEAVRLRARESRPDTPPAAPTLTLRPPERRGPKPPAATVTAPPAASVVQLRLMLPAALGTVEGPFDVTARDWFTGRTVWILTAAKPTPTAGAGLAVVAHVSGEMLAPGSYELLVRPSSGPAAPEPLASYEVSVGG